MNTWNAGVSPELWERGRLARSYWNAGVSPSLLFCWSRAENEGLMERDERLEQLEWRSQVAARRLEKLERRHRRLRALCFLSTAAAAVSMAFSWPTAQAMITGQSIHLEQHGVLRTVLLGPNSRGRGEVDLSFEDPARQFGCRLTCTHSEVRLELSDRTTRERRAALSLSAVGPALELSDPKNGWELKGAVDASGPTIQLRAREGDAWRPRAELHLNDQGPGLRFFDSKGEAATSPAVATSPAPSKEDRREVLEVRRLRLVDEKGAARAELAIDAGRPTLEFLSDKRKKMLRLVGDSDGASIELFDKEGRARTVLSTSKIGFGSSLELLDEKGSPRVRIGDEEETGSAQLQVWDSENRLRVGLGVQQESSFLGLSGLDGKPRALLGVMGYLPSLDFFNKDERRIVTMGVDERGSTIGLADGDGKPRAVLSVGSTGSDSHLSFLNREAKIRCALGVADQRPGLQLWSEDGSLLRRIP